MTINRRRIVIGLTVCLLIQLACVCNEIFVQPPPEPILKLPTPTPTLIPPTVTPLPVTVTPAASITQIQDLGRISTTQIDQQLAAFLPANNQLPSRYEVQLYRIRFQTIDEYGQLTETRADLRIPIVNTPIQFPVFIYGSGTTGVGNDCATLDENYPTRNWGNYRDHMLSYTTQGFITLIPNWLGFDDRYRTHPYFNKKLEAHVMLDATRALYKFFETAPSDILARPAEQVFYGGYSQGGHGAFAADVYASEYAPELVPRIKGIIGHAMSPNIEALLYDSPRYSAFVVYAFRDFYGEEVITPEQVLLPRWLPTFDADATTNCIDNAFRYYIEDPRQMYTPLFFEALYNGRMTELFPEFKEKLDENYSGLTVDVTRPAILLHGAQDPVVTPRVIEQYISRLCNSGKNVVYRLYSDANHFTTRQFGFRDTLNWMRTILEGGVPQSECRDFFMSQQSISIPPANPPQTEGN